MQQHSDVGSKLLLSVAEAAKTLSMSRDGVYRLLWGAGPEFLRSIKVGRRRLLPRRELERWISYQLGDEDPPPAA